MSSISSTIAGGGVKNYAAIREQLKSFKGWNYVAVHKIALFSSLQFPCLGRVRPGAQSPTSQRSRHFRTYYTGRRIQSANVDVQEIDAHPLIDVLRYVNDAQTWGEFIYETQMYWQLTGRFFWWVIPNGLRGHDGRSLPRALWCVPPDWVRQIRSRDGKQLIGWELIPENDYSRRRRLAPDEIADVKFPSPLSKTEAWSPTMAGASWIDNSQWIEDSRAATFRNSGKPDLILKLDEKRYTDPQESTLRRIKERFMARSSGVKHHGEPLIVPPGVDAEPWDRTAQEMDYPDSSAEMRDNTLAIRGMNKFICGLSQDMNRADVEAAMVAFCTFVMNPLNAWVSGGITKHLASRYSPDLEAWYDDCAPDDRDANRRDAETDWKMGAITPEERRTDQGRETPDHPAYKTGWIPAGLQPLDDSEFETDDEPEEPQAPPPPPPEGDAETEDDDAEQSQSSRNRVAQFNGTGRNGHSVGPVGVQF